MSRGERRLAAIMFTDVADFAGQTQANEELALQLLQEHRRILRSIFPKYAGKEVKTIGDGFLVEFASAVEAANCALEIQQALAQRNLSSTADKQVLVRIGIHVGDIFEQENDIMGDGVNIAARIQPLAEPGGICISQQVYDQVQNKLEEQFVRLDPKGLKHIQTQIEVYKIEPAKGKGRVRQVSLEKRRIAVLPLANVSRDPKDEFFADGMTDELISTLSKIGGFGVIARTSSMKYKGANKSVAEIGTELNVGTIIEGSVRKSGDRLRIMVQAIDTAKEEPLWSQEYDRNLKDVFAIQGDIAKRTAAALKVKIMQIEAKGLEKKATEDTEAYTLYLKGRYFQNKRTEEGLMKAIQQFEKALKRDRKYALALTVLADSYALLALFEFLPPKKAFPTARLAAGKALELDDELAEAHTSLGLVRFQYDRDWPDAEAEFRRAIELNSNYAPAHHFYADFLKAMGRFEEALSEIRRAQELDPLSLSINTGVGHVLYLSRKYDQAIEQYRKTVELDSNFLQARLWFGRPYLQKGMYKEAIGELRKAVELSGGSTIAWAMLGHGYASAGQRKEAIEILDKLRKRAKTKYVPSYWIATIYNGLGDKNKAFSWLEKAFRERSSWLAWVKVEPRFDPLRSDARFQSLLARMKLE
jgi:TolB-like protein/cytochrome c-type biogenesis protein CcmH/NrfG